MSHSQLLQAILATDDDTPRLVYADYCEDRGDTARAELIRAQCEHARLPPWERRSIELLHRIRALLAGHGKRWYRELGALEGARWGAFHRGFVQGVVVPSVGVLLQHASALRSLAPIEDVTLSENEFATENDLVDPRCQDLPWLRGLKLTGRFEFQQRETELLLGSPLVRGLRRLDLTDVGMENEGARLIAEATHMDQLRTLNLTNGFVGEQGVAALAGARHLASLEHLVFSSYGGGYVDDPFVTDAAVEGLLSEGSHLSGLVSLRLGGNQVGTATLRALLETRRLLRLQEIEIRLLSMQRDAFELADGPARFRVLRLAGVRLPEDILEQMSSLPQLEKLAVLDLEACDLSSKSLEWLSRARFTSELRSLTLSRNKLGRPGARALARGTWPRLNTLKLVDVELDTEAVDALADARMPDLAVLDLSSNHLGALPDLSSSSWASSLRRLYATENDLGPESVPSLLALQGLTLLELGHNQLKDGVASLVKAPWPHLTDLGLQSNHCGDEAVVLAAGQPWLRRLLSLELAECELSAGALEHLLDAGPLALRELDLSRNREIDSAIEQLASGEALPALVFLSLAHCGMDAPALEALARSPLRHQLERLRWHGNDETEQVYDLLEPLRQGEFAGDWIVEGEAADE